MNWRVFDRLATGVTVGFSVLGLLYLLTPILVIVPISFSADRFFTLPIKAVSYQWYDRLWNNPGYLLAFGNTAAVGLATALMSATLGTLAALAVVRGKVVFGRPISGIVMAPLVMPQIILAIGVFPVVASVGMIGSKLAVAAVHSAVATSLVFTTVSAALRGYSPNMELSAMTLGAGHVNTFRHVTFPMIRLGILIGAIFAFAFSFDEIIIALFLTDASSVTLPVYMWNEIRFQMDPTIAAASAVAIVFSLSLLSAVALLQRVGHHHNTSAEATR
ncbi:MAG: ABC transporter permease [Mesorhizobium sp.]|uniref:ABC transporter permease n=1 Tax=Mesorhizobium sp. TaxID=1871066 RepID=UPI000FE470D4|nr:ABC transporter permease [Mesorhizobium sp.]RWB28300.1 MAG: ABC transporter permease [Mesorhizobium sp.]RWB83349.1 MAG: ABC transporter permease [Mesorhizobium sp.]RWD29418.1 MAG: ABC transporter permease [Mesorhizobium sp.]RWF73521.1 MAG: ABC transporter permease [Mesorhizobium sp.]TIS62780.1 MAG: ABC transporter permease [Mesorhizobium sp.]